MLGSILLFSLSSYTEVRTCALYLSVVNDVIVLLHLHHVLLPCASDSEVRPVLLSLSERHFSGFLMLLSYIFIRIFFLLSHFLNFVSKILF